MRLAIAVLTYAGVCLLAAPRPMTFLDVVEMRTASKPAVSPDGKWAVYSLLTPDWKQGRSFSDLYLAPMAEGVAAARRMTFTKGKNETGAQWSRDSSYFVFTSNREASATAATEQQLYAMRPDGGEAQRIGSHKEGVGAFAFSPDGKWLVYVAGKKTERQIWVLPAAEVGTAEPKPLTKHATPVTAFLFSRDGKQIYFTAPETAEKASFERIEKKFTAKIRNEDTPLDHLWVLDVESRTERRLTGGAEYTVSSLVVSPDSKWLGFRGTPKDRYRRAVTEAATYADLYLLDTATGTIERLTNNKDIRESSMSFSPDSATVAFVAADDFTYFRNEKVYVRPVKGGSWREIGGLYDENMGIDFWSNDGGTIYFNGGKGATQQLFGASVVTGTVRQVTNLPGLIAVDQDEDSKALVIRYTDSSSPADYYTVASVDDVAVRPKWRALTNTNPQVSEIALGHAEAVQWKSTDGKTVEGVLVKPVGYEAGKQYPLIVQIHGGPAGASTLGFNATYSNYSHVYAGSGYLCLLPNYRGSTNYGEKFRMEISGDYFRQGYEDIMSGVDYLIAQGMADPARMGVMGWSAGGHWSNWILTHTDRFKAISSGAGAMNWISMFAQTDVQRNREFYFQGAPYDRFDHFWNVSPLKYIKNAKTPTLIHVVDGDPRVPRPQSEELHMALRKLGVPTEFLVYPGNTHGISDARNQMVKMTAEFGWFERYLRGKEEWLDWQQLLDTLKEDKSTEKTSDTER